MHAEEPNAPVALPTCTENSAQHCTVRKRTQVGGYRAEWALGLSGQRLSTARIAEAAYSLAGLQTISAHPTPAECIVVSAQRKKRITHRITDRQRLGSYLRMCRASNRCNGTQLHAHSSASKQSPEFYLQAVSPGTELKLPNPQSLHPLPVSLVPVGHCK
jgi:hypothetical protein